MPAPAPGSEPWLEDVAKDVGLDFVQWSGAAGRLDFLEMMGGGCALFDADGDGDLDVYLAQGALLRPSDDGKTLVPLPKGEKGGLPMDRFYRNESTDGTLRFVDATGASGLVATGYGQGVATGDVDGDGLLDVFVANYGPDQLWRSRGDGTFEDLTTSSAIAGDDRGWSAGGTFFDAEGDGDLDLFVISYVEWTSRDDRRCYDASSRLNFCGPEGYQGAVNRFYRNRGNGTFEDATTAAGMLLDGLPSLGVVAFDANEDHRLDLYVANDGQVNRLWLQQPSGTFRDEALLAGLAVNGRGMAEAGMGLAAGDADDDGDLDLFVSHLETETNTLYADLGGGLFEDRTLAYGLSADSLAFTSFGTVFADLDLDGRLDLPVVSGAVRLPVERTPDLVPGPRSLGQANQLFVHLADGPRGPRFEDRSELGGKDFLRLETSRGLALGDIDGDGDEDLLVTQIDAPVRLFRNRIGDGKPWLGVRVLEPAGRPDALRDALGAVVSLQREGGAPRVRRAATDGSFACASDPRIRFALEGFGEVTGVSVRWTDGREETFAAPQPGGYTSLVRGRGLDEPRPAGSVSPQQ
ncbi:MAG: CRTAC1 family protein [Thermoanaerobaculia bacterium]|nr:CRTAC1 family protein [Thermoanaerobaculia bacterium]